MDTNTNVVSAELVNLTPHVINLYDDAGKNQLVALQPAGTVARCAVASEPAGIVQGVTLFRTTYGEVTDLPESVTGVIYVVSQLVRAALPQRTDLASPGELLRDDAGQPKGCKGLAWNG